ncbi:MAG: OmpH family outer membrane protein [Kiritimatiellae bacterium]|nr:OmpH family outer membrane protein [Kiritimatiellia bacterium]
MKSVGMFAAALALSIASAAYAQQRIAVVDFEKLVRLHPNTADDKRQLEATLKDYNAQKEQLQNVAVSTRKAFEEAAREAANPALSDSARQKAEATALEKRQAALEADRNAAEKVRELQRDLNEQEMRMLRRTSQIIERAISAYAKGNNIDIVLQLPSRLGAGSGVVYNKDDADITSAIMALLGIEEPKDEEEGAGADGDAAKEAEKDKTAKEPAPAAASADAAADAAKE